MCKTYQNIFCFADIHNLNVKGKFIGLIITFLLLVQRPTTTSLNIRDTLVTFFTCVVSFVECSSFSKQIFSPYLTIYNSFYVKILLMKLILCLRSYKILFFPFVFKIFFSYLLPNYSCFSSLYLVISLSSQFFILPTTNLLLIIF